MFFGARITYKRDPELAPGLFALRIWQETRPLYYVWAQVPDNILTDIYKQGGSVIRNDVSGFVDEKFTNALLRWCIRETEQRLRNGRLDEKLTGLIPIVVTPSDVSTILFFEREKTCDYQQRFTGRALFCSAASPNDRSVTFREGPIRLAPTTTQLCKRCDLPDTELICGYLAHPIVYGALPDKFSSIVTQRLMEGAYCDDGKNKNGSGNNCRAGGNDCWVRNIEIALDRPAAPYSPRELPTALDFLNVMWERSFKQPLFGKATFQKSASLSLPCGNQDEFIARVGDLNELLRKMDIPDKLLPNENKSSGAHPIPEAEKLNRLSACLHKNLNPDEEEQITKAIDILKAINVIRNKITHGGAELIGALQRLGIEYPIFDYEESWDRIRSRAAEALSMIRSSLETLS